MRIKFRAWDKKKERWATHYDECYIGEDGNCYATGDTGGYYSSMCLIRIEAEINLFTGLKDKNGKEVYEGDALQCYYGGNKLGAIETVEFKNGAFWLRHRDVSIATWLEQDGPYETDIEILGNIYSNPELIK